MGDLRVIRAFQVTNSKKSPDPDGMGLFAIRTLFFSWDTQRVVALIRAHVRLGVHPDHWKLARGVIIPKPGKGGCPTARAYCCIPS